MRDGPVWRNLLAAATARLGDAAEARRIVEEASGFEGAELVLHLDEPSRALTHERWVSMVDRRAAGEPLQYVLGRWGFRSLDLHVDRRVLIPRPETEQVVEVALSLLEGTTVVDLGTGSGAIALSIAVERPATTVWATDVSTSALDVARANAAGAGRSAARVRLVDGDWYAALPPDLEGRVDLIVANPPYVAASDPLPDEVARWEPRRALVPGPSGLEAIEVVVTGAPRWLRPGGWLVLEIGEAQGRSVQELLAGRGLLDVEVRPDLSGRDRIAIGRRG